LSTQTIKASKVASNVPTEEAITDFLSYYNMNSLNVKKKIYTTTMKLIR